MSRMPTNPKWLEHTERAAWDTVKTLRQKLEDQEARITRLFPVHESWQRMIAALDTASERHGIDEERYADVLDALCAKLDGAVTRQEELESRLSAEEASRREQVVEVVSVAPSRAVASDDDEDTDDERDRYASRVRELVLALSKDSSGAKRPSVERLITRAEMKFEQLEDARSEDAFELAAEIGALALAVARRRQRRR